LEINSLPSGIPAKICQSSAANFKGAVLFGPLRKYYCKQMVTWEFINQSQINGDGKAPV